MNTQCPHCGIVFHVTEVQLSQADSLVRCGQCLKIFNGRNQLLADNAEMTETTPDFFKHMLLGRPQHSKWAIAGWSGAILLAASVLLLQVAYMQRANLVENERLVPLVTTFCRHMPGCELPPRRDLNRIQLISRNVYSHPNTAGVLIVSAVITNAAPFAQPYPVLLVSMSNTRGQTIAERYFRPDEYLPERLQPDSDMEPGKAVPVTLSVMDPGNQAMAFELDFL